MQNLTFVPTKETMDWLEKNRLMIEDCTLRIDWSRDVITLSVLHKDKSFLVCSKEFSLNDPLTRIDIPGITFPIKFAR